MGDYPQEVDRSKLTNIKLEVVQARSELQRYTNQRSNLKPALSELSMNFTRYFSVE